VKAFLLGFFSRFGKVTFLAYLGFSIGYSFLMIGVLLLVSQIGMFSIAGQEDALQDDQNGFSNFPEVTLQAPDGKKSKYRIVECYGSFCAVYQKAPNEKKGHAYAVPASAITWSTTPDPVTSPVAPKPTTKGTSNARTNSG
jgi:hypothetical protein